MTSVTATSAKTQDRFSGRGDEFYVLLLQAHHGLNETESAALDARLLLLLANEVGDVDRLATLIAEARRTPPAPKG